MHAQRLCGKAVGFKKAQASPSERWGLSMAKASISQGANASPGFTDAVLSIVILCDIRFFRESLVDILGRDRTLKILGAMADYGETFERSLALRPDIVLIDTALPNGLAAVRRTRLLAPWVHVVAFAMAETEENVVAWAEVGAAGYIPRTAGLAELVSMLQNVMRGEQVCSSRVASCLMRRIANPTGRSKSEGKPCDPPPLTRRELQIVQLINAGLSNKEIARRLNIGLATTKSHVHNVLGKLRLGRRGQAALWMREHECGPTPEVFPAQPSTDKLAKPALD